MKNVIKILTFLVTSLYYCTLYAGSYAGSIETSKEPILSVQNEVKVVISDQLDAFALSNIDRAYYHASKSIKAMFSNSKVFGHMVKTSYPMIWAPKTYEFLGISEERNKVLQRVMFTDVEGRMHFFDYILELDDGRWVISGVYLLEGEERV